jgi:hypothetical protein
MAKLEMTHVPFHYTLWSGKPTSNASWRPQLRYWSGFFKLFISAWRSKPWTLVFWGLNFLINIQSSTSRTIENELFHLVTQKGLITNHIVSPSYGTCFKKSWLTGYNSTWLTSQIGWVFLWFFFILFQDQESTAAIHPPKFRGPTSSQLSRSVWRVARQWACGTCSARRPPCDFHR